MLQSSKNEEGAAITLTVSLQASSGEAVKEELEEFGKEIDSSVFSLLGLKSGAKARVIKWVNG